MTEEQLPTTQQTARNKRKRKIVTFSVEVKPRGESDGYFKGYRSGYKNADSAKEHSHCLNYTSRDCSFRAVKFTKEVL